MKLRDLLPMLVLIGLAFAATLVAVERMRHALEERAAELAMPPDVCELEGGDVLIYAESDDCARLQRAEERAQ